MPLYAYQALNASGKRLKGSIDAESIQEVKEKLRQQGLMVSSIFLSRGVKGSENLKGDALVNFTLQLSQLLGGGIPLYESLVALEEQYRSDSFHRVILSLSEQVKSGRTLSYAMSGYPESFNKQYTAMIAAGESVGALDVVLARLTELLKKQSLIKKKIATAMIYPGILAGFCLMILALLLGFVVPSIEGVFEGRELNGFTTSVIGVSHFMNAWWWVVVPLICGAIALAFYKLRSAEGRFWFQRQGLKLPVIKTLMIHASVARFCRTLATLQQGGLPIIESLQISREVMQNIVLEEEILRAEKKIVEGSCLSAELKVSKYMPILLARMVAVGEEAGTTDKMLAQVAEMYEGELDKSLDRVMALMQPGILIVMGMMIGLILLAVLLPLTDISSLSM